MRASPATAGLLPVLSVPTCGTELYALYTPTSNPQLTQLGYKADNMEYTNLFGKQIFL